ncbi:hypothetical protein P154DRAFT_537971 [Amniculicola lignicola CBS 123094]|uniref:PHD-type domain-containing protein n=1 Tax=Amniculicola lignicola CBS 123094 TaxID=1392246 RepID=A0A6A5W3F2_9PLEO|nr:hypothetical protein P154DRAFT_537971 [Amniculicola lignicola CBS 123094]
MAQMADQNPPTPENVRIQLVITFLEKQMELYNKITDSLTEIELRSRRLVNGTIDQVEEGGQELPGNQATEKENQRKGVVASPEDTPGPTATVSDRQRERDEQISWSGNEPIEWVAPAAQPTEGMSEEEERQEHRLGGDIGGLSYQSVLVEDKNGSDGDIVCSKCKEVPEKAVICGNENCTGLGGLWFCWKCLQIELVPPDDQWLCPQCSRLPTRKIQWRQL